MEERYEIRGKIGQGGIGSVFRGYDLRMNREVAIKRITKTGGDTEFQEESTRQLMKEAGALASLQHPHIVTIYDVGTDEDGPYVVMELISGKTLDELIEHAPLTWPDFRELALQTQEALIAAHELDMIHSDLKPSNLMLTWLPSGKFQLKIVDFGLATLTQSQSKEEIESLDAVYGSIFFMAPEQFERVPLDARSDLYSMGCVYYQALTGVYPFNGETGNDVMVSHLHHTVTPVQHLRSDIPMWACDWIMWQINRLPQDRPESAREALSIFLENDKIPNPTMSLGVAPSDHAAAKRPRLIITGSEPQPTTDSVVVAESFVEPLVVPEPLPEPHVESEPEPMVKPVPKGKPILLVKRAPLAEPEPLVAPEVVVEPEPIVEPEPVVEPVAVVEPEPQPVLQVQSAVKEVAKLATTPSVQLVTTAVATAKVSPATVVAPRKTTPQPLTPPAGSKPSVHNSPQVVFTPEPQPEPVITAAASPIPETPDAVVVPKAGKRKLSTPAKTMIASVLGLIAVFLVWILLERSGQNHRTESYNKMIAVAAELESETSAAEAKFVDASVAGSGAEAAKAAFEAAKMKKIPVNKTELQILLDAAVNTGVVENRPVIYSVLSRADATDGTDVDAVIVEFTLKQDMLQDVRDHLITDVIKQRKNPSVVPALMTYALAATDTHTSVIILQAVGAMAGDGQFEKFLEVLLSDRPPAIRKAAEDALAEIIIKSQSRGNLATGFVTAYGGKLNPEARQAVLRLMGRCGGPKALELVKKALEGTDPIDKIAAITALSTWGDDSAYPLLIEFLAGTEDAKLRPKAFDSALNFALATLREKDAARAQKQWTDLAGQAKTPAEQLAIIKALVFCDDEWAFKIIEVYNGSDDGKVSQLASKAIDKINKRKPAKKPEKE